MLLLRNWASIGPGGIEMLAQRQAVLLYYLLQSDRVELKLDTAIATVESGVASIGPGGIEIGFVVPGSEPQYALQSDRVELKSPGGACTLVANSWLQSDRVELKCAILVSEGFRL